MIAAEAARLRGAFPRQFGDDVEAVCAVLGKYSHPTSEFDVGPTVVRAERIRIPMRIYYPEPTLQQLSDLSDRQRLVARCWLSRHHDGHVRERMVREVLRDRSLWTAPYVIQLLGEYVLEIIQLLEDGIVASHEEPYAEFLCDNSEFWQLTRQRVISYWDCYYRRSDFPDRAEYPGSRVVERLEAWRARRAGSRVRSLEAIRSRLRARYRVETLSASAERLCVRFPDFPDAILAITPQDEGRFRATYPKIATKASGNYHELEATAERVLLAGLDWIAEQLARHGRVIPEFIDGPLPPVRRNKP